MDRVLFDSYEIVSSIEEEMFIDELRRFFTRNSRKNRNGFVVFGTIERWDGACEGGCFFRDLAEFWNTEVLKDCDYNRWYIEDGKLQITGSHHDGNVYLEIRQLTEKGYEVYEEYGVIRDICEDEEEIYSRKISSFLTTEN